jgi:hypothetical protein
VRILAAALLLVTASSRAFADDAVTDDASTEQLMSMIKGNQARLYKGGGLRVDAEAGITSDLDVPAAVTGNASIGYDLPLCRVVGIGGSGMLGYDEGDRLSSWTGSGTLCIPVPANTITFTLTHGQNVRSSLFERQETIRNRESMWRGDLRLRAWQYRGEHNMIDAVALDAQVDFVSSPGVPSSSSLGLGMNTVRWTKPGAGLNGDRIVDVFRVEIENPIDEGAKLYSDSFTMIPLRIENFRIGSRVGVTGGIGVTSGDLNAVQKMPTTTPAPPVKESTRAYGELGVETDLGVLVAGVTGKRTNHALFDGQVVLDDRLSLTLRRDRKHWSTHAEGYLARQEVVRITPGAVVGVGGGAFEAQWKFKAPFSATLHTEAGRTITAVSAAEPIAAEWDVRATVGLSANYSAIFR